MSIPACSEPFVWGVLGTARTALLRFIPGVLEAGHAVGAIASRDSRRAQSFAAKACVERAYGSYEELLADPAVDAVYICLPNHLHVEWSNRAAAAGKHVLCEKPIALSAGGVRALIGARDRTGQLIAEALMIFHHPQWDLVEEALCWNDVCDIRSAHLTIAYDNREPSNIRNQVGCGGGALYDIGCYAVAIYRRLFKKLPDRVLGSFELDELFGIDRTASGILDFSGAHATFTCATQRPRQQRLEVLTANRKVIVETPVNPDEREPARVLVTRIDQGDECEQHVLLTASCNQYARQAAAFATAASGGVNRTMSLETSLANARVMDALRASAHGSRWVKP